MRKPLHSSPNATLRNSFDRTCRVVKFLRVFRKLRRIHAAERDTRPLYVRALHCRKNFVEQSERNERERNVEFHFIKTNMVAYLHYLFPGAASITASRQAAVTQTRIATAGACSRTKNRAACIDQAYRCAFSFLPRIIRV